MKFQNLNPDYGWAYVKEPKQQKRGIVEMPRPPRKNMYFIMKPRGYFEEKKRRGHKPNSGLAGLHDVERKPKPGFVYIMRPGGYFSVRKEKKII